MKINNIYTDSYDNRRSGYFSFNALAFFTILLLLYLGLLYYSNTSFLTDSVYYNSYSGSVAGSGIARIIGIKNKFIWISYILFPAILYVKLIFSSVCIKTRLVLSNTNLDWKTIFRIVLFSELAFLLSALAKVIILTFFKGVNTLNDVQLYTPFSLYGLFSSPSIVPKYLIYPLQAFNLFELLYWVLLSFGLSTCLKINFARSFLLVLTSYGIGLLFWILFLMFITISYS